MASINICLCVGNDWFSTCTNLGYSSALLELKKLSQDKFSCEADAIKALSKLSK
ncbi:MAG: hypothetical protein V7K79_05505 [Nostoc sp.]